eukprot:201081-Pleurochrysis_carterae.AAC.3
MTGPRVTWLQEAETGNEAKNVLVQEALLSTILVNKTFGDVKLLHGKAGSKYFDVEVVATGRKLKLNTSITTLYDKEEQPPEVRLLCKLQSNKQGPEHSLSPHPVACHII